MPDKSRKPLIRFKGFTDDWEQRKLGEISTSYSGGTPSVGVKEYYSGEIPFIRSAEINSNTTELFLTKYGLEHSSAKMVEVFSDSCRVQSSRAKNDSSSRALPAAQA